MARILIVYSTTDGHTRKICERLRAVIERHAHQVRLAPVAEVTDTDLEPFEKVVVGASSSASFPGIPGRRPSSPASWTIRATAGSTA
jgi:flavodoxin